MPIRKKLYGTRSRCCGSKSLIVQSRAGGFITQNCESCGTPRRITIQQLPTLPCRHCDCELRKTRDRRGNYVYSCLTCSLSLRVADLVPRWQEYFEECGVGVGSDSAAGSSNAW